ncbi:MAG: phosphoribosyl-ATP diphosphatase [SAR116 cluster bacterium]|nr:phosphoribosyl-ATP diphosphatase [SAR116 cluster bacterium]RPG90740.1 MAG: phosphoribosyl-ATP diphosphatase [Candidatus Puniceispirillum sp. TMED213]
MADQINKVDLRHSLDRLYDVIASRKNGSPEDSYTAQLFAKAPENPARKLCEEATEVLIEALNHNKVKLTAESADLLYHLLVVWAAADIDPQDVWQELDRRQGTSGLVEKQSRKL